MGSLSRLDSQADVTSQASFSQTTDEKKEAKNTPSTTPAADNEESGAFSAAIKSAKVSTLFYLEKPVCIECFSCTDRVIQCCTWTVDLK